MRSDDGGDAREYFEDEAEDLVWELGYGRAGVHEGTNECGVKAEPLESRVVPSLVSDLRQRFEFCVLRLQGATVSGEGGPGSKRRAEQFVKLGTQVRRASVGFRSLV